MGQSTSIDAEEAAARGPRIKRGDYIAMGAVTAVLLAVAIWVGVGMAEQPVRWRDVGFDTANATSASATFEVFLYTDEPIQCVVQALNSSYAVVGIGELTVDRADGAAQRHTVTVATTEQATTALVDYCDLAAP